MRHHCAEVSSHATRDALETYLDLARRLRGADIAPQEAAQVSPPQRALDTNEATIPDTDEQAQKHRERFAKLLRVDGGPVRIPPEEVAGVLLAWALPDRLAFNLSRDEINPAYRLANGLVRLCAAVLALLPSSAYTQLYGVRATLAEHRSRICQKHRFWRIWIRARFVSY